MTKRRNPLDRYASDIAPGELTWIGVRPKRREPLELVSNTRAIATLGLEGDHRMGKTPGSGRKYRLSPKSSLRRQRISWDAMPSIRASCAVTLLSKA